MRTCVLLGLVALFLWNFWDLLTGFRRDRIAQRAWEEAQWDCPGGAELKAWYLAQEHRSATAARR